MLVVAALVPVAYLLGTSPSAVMVARANGVDITAAGSGNPGASNVARVLGTKWGLVVFILDALKGALPAALALAVLDSRPAVYPLVAAATLGHMFPVSRRMRGGKGVATVGGAMLVAQPLVSAVLVVVWVGVRKVSGTASLASVVIAIGLPVGVAAAGAPAWEVLAVIGLALLVMLRHTGNLRRLVGGTELAAHRSPV